MKIDDLWDSLEAETKADRAARSGWLLRLANPAAACHVFLSLELPSRRRGVLIKIPEAFIPKQQNWPHSRGLEPAAVEISGSTHFGVFLKEQQFSDVFSALVLDLARRMEDANTPEAQGQAFLSQLKRWHRFLSASTEGLSGEQQRGLWGELFLLRQHLLPIMGMKAIEGWKGSARAHQDFQFPNGSIEVKTTLAKQPQVVRITSERQLDDTGIPVIFLAVIAIDQQETTGETLPALIESLRTILTTELEAREMLEDSLLAAGYLDIHTPRYAEYRYQVRSERFFRTGPLFPRIIESMLPEGIGEVSYGLSVAACHPYAVEISELMAMLA